MPLENATHNYAPPIPANWQGRCSNPKYGPQYWHEQIELIDLRDENLSSSLNETAVALVGYACDEGVRRNFGRIGAKQGPTILRQRLSKLAIHDDLRIADIGDIICHSAEQETCQQLLSETISHLLEHSILPIVIGGGHDVAYGHFMGIQRFLEKKTNLRIGIINFDAHWDLRPIDKEANSGTPFNQILSNYHEEVEYFALGIQKQSNTKELFQIAKQYAAKYVLAHDCIESNLENIRQSLSSFIGRNDYLYITIDLDGFSSAYAPGVSAPSPLGFTPYFVFDILQHLFNSKKVISIDIAELNPLYDQDNVTSNLAARLVDFVTTLRHTL